MKPRIPLLALTGTLLLVALFLAGTAVPAVQANPAVFINEIHYDNAGTDTGEAIEIAGPAGTDLTGWTIVLYNGSGGAAYNTTSLVGPLPDQGGGFGTALVSYSSNGIQNGSPDGVALVDASNHFSFGPLTLAEGINSFAIRAVDPAGNTAGTELSVTLDSSVPAPARCCAARRCSGSTRSSGGWDPRASRC